MSQKMIPPDKPVSTTAEKHGESTKTFRSAAKVSEMKAKDEVCTLRLTREQLC